MTSPHTAAGLADRQGLFREVRRLSEYASHRAALGEGPWISISRELGSRGSELALLLGDALGWRVYDREILAAVAAETHSGESLVDRFDEKGVREVGEYLAPLILPEDPGQARVLVGMTRVIRKLGREGRAILVGRGANFILLPAGGLRVRAAAPPTARAEALAAAEGIPLEHATRRVVETDAAQRMFVRQAFQRDIDDLAAYDLVVNPLALGLPAAAAAIVAAARAKLAIEG